MDMEYKVGGDKVTYESYGSEFPGAFEWSCCGENLEEQEEERPEYEDADWGCTPCPHAAARKAYFDKRKH